MPKAKKEKPNVTKPPTFHLPCPQPTTALLAQGVIISDDVWVPPQGPGLHWSFGPQGVGESLSLQDPSAQTKPVCSRVLEFVNGNVCHF